MVLRSPTHALPPVRVDAVEVVVAAGFDHEPFIPDWSGRLDWPGDLVHSSRYRNPVQYEGKRVLVVGAGCSGMEIAYDLATDVACVHPSWCARY